MRVIVYEINIFEKNWILHWMGQTKKEMIINRIIIGYFIHICVYCRWATNSEKLIWASGKNIAIQQFFYKFFQELESLSF